MSLLVRRRMTNEATSGPTFELHEVTFTVTEKTKPDTILNMYISQAIEFCYFPITPNTQTNTIARGLKWPDVNLLGETGSSAGNTAFDNNVNTPTQYNVNDQSYNVIRERTVLNFIPPGTYKLKFYGIPA